MSTDITKQVLSDIATCDTPPRVSVIMIFFNAERFMDEAIRSVFAQTFDDWELLLVDDGSTDRSSEIAREWIRDHPRRAVYLQHESGENRGMSASRNLGISRSRGRYLAFLDADDVWLPEKLEQQVQILEEQPAAAMVYGSTQYWASWTGNEEDRGRDFVADLGITPNALVQPPALVPVLLRNQIVTTTGALARRDAVANIGGFEESFQGLHEDQVFYVKLCLRAPVFVSDKTWYRYRRHSESCCAIAEKSGRHHEQRRVFLRWLERYLGDTGLGDNGVWRELKKARWHAEHPALARSANDLRYRVRVKRERLKAAIRKRVPSALYERLRRLRHGTRFVPARGRVDFGDLRRADPISRVFGFDRGRPVDRYYVEDFLARNSEFIRGRVLEIGDDSYTRAFGADRVIETDILSVVENSPRATIIADLAAAGHIPSNTFDCIILTQTLHLIYDVRAAVETLHRILKPGGVLLATMPGISQIDHYDWRESWYWSFTRLSAERLFAGVFTAGKIALETRGNVLAATAFLQGLACDELKPEELDYRDDDYQVVIAVRAHK